MDGLGSHLICTLEKNQHLSRATGEDVGPTAGRGMNRPNLLCYYYFEGAGFYETLEDVPGKDNYIDLGHASIGAGNPRYVSVGDVTTGYATTKNLENGAAKGLYPAVRLGVNPSPERCVDGAATWKSVDTLGKKQHLTRATRKDVGPAARRSGNRQNAFEMGVFNAKEPKEDEEHVYSEISYGLNPH